MAKKNVTQAIKDLEMEAKLRQEVNSGLDSYLAKLLEYREKQKELNKLKDAELDIQTELNAMLQAGSGASAAQIKAKKLELKAIKEMNKELSRKLDIEKKVLAEANKGNMVLAKSGKLAIDAVGKSVSLLGKGYGKLKSLGLFDMDKAMKKSALSMGLFSNQSASLRKNITAAAEQSLLLGGSVEDYSEIQTNFSDEIGRAVQLSDKGLKSIFEMGKATGMASGEAGELAGQFDKIGVGAEATAKFMNQALNDSQDMGINSTKVIKNIAKNISMMNKYRFKDGIKGLTKMALLSTKLGVEMDFASSMSEKLWDIEGAVEMSAQLQVLGGAWARLADPFKLMYQARNDAEGLTESIANAAAESMYMAKDGSIQMNAMEMHRLRKIAEQTGLEYEKLAEAGKQAYRLSKVKTSTVGMSDDMKEFIANTAKFKDGKAYIEIDGNEKLVSMLTDQDKLALKKIRAEKKSNEEIAKQALTFDEAFTNTVNGLKVFLLPIIEAINKKMLPALNNFTETFKKEKWGDTIKYFAEKVGNFVATIGKFIIDNPIESALVYFGTKIIGNLVQWGLNGAALFKGFNTAAKLSGWGSGGGTGGMGGSGLPSGAKGGKWASAGKGAIAGAALGGANMLMSDEPVSGNGVGKLIGGILGGAAGTLLDPFLGPFGTILGAELGSMLGGAIGDSFDDSATVKPDVNDGVIKFNQKDKFTKVDDNTMIAGTNENGNKDLAKALTIGAVGGPLAGIGSYLFDKFTNEKKASQPTKSQSTIIKVEFGEMSINGNISVNIPGGKELGIELSKDSTFRTNITNIVQSNIEKAINGGKNKG